MEKLVIVGAGAGGVILANSLDTKKFEITIIDKSPTSVFQPAYLYAAFKGYNANIERPTQKLLKKGISLKIEEVKKIDLANRNIATNVASYSYDKLVIATGSITDVSQISGLPEVNSKFGDYHTSLSNARKLWHNLTEFNGGTIAIGMASPTCKCPPSPLEGVFLTEEFIAKRNLKEKTKIVFFVPYPRAYPAEPMNDVIAPILSKRGIETYTFFDVDRIDPEKRTIYSIEGDAISYDLPIIIPPCVGARIEYNPAEVVDSDRFIKADKYTMKVQGFDDAFAIGDATAIPTAKSGVTAHLQAKTVAKILNGLDAKFDGRTNCPFDMGYGKGSFIIGSYTEPVVKYPPTRLKLFMKLMMEKIYWQSLKGTYDFIFDLYFKRTDPAKLNKKYGSGKGIASAAKVDAK
ncbi:MAG: NAD(P)/FAD-dependent oxidoreductase [Candidatus Micrarchaeia archaeon]